MKIVDIIGNRYGRLIVVKELDAIKYTSRGRERRFLCKCDCGGQVIAPLYRLKYGNVLSCGCLKKDCGKGIAGKEADNPRLKLYRTWRDMKNRCRAKSGRYYRNYTSRGITVCDEWKNSFESFYNWAINNGYASTLSIDRIDGSKGYSPNNCRWATPKEQANNIRTNIVLTYNGVSHTLREWSEIVGIKPMTLRSRKMLGWSVEKILTTPPQHQNKNSHE